MLGVHSITDDPKALWWYACLPTMVVAQLITYGEECICHAVEGTPQETSPKWKSCQHVQLVAVFAMDKHRHFGQASRGHCFNRAPIARVDDVGPILLHDCG